MDVNITIRHDAHRAFKSRDIGSRHTIYSTKKICNAVADSGAQTLTSGAEILEIFNCPMSYLIMTRHRINGITSDGLQVIGALSEHNGHNCSQRKGVARNHVHMRQHYGSIPIRKYTEGTRRTTRGFP